MDHRDTKEDLLSLTMDYNPKDAHYFILFTESYTNNGHTFVPGDGIFARGMDSSVDPTELVCFIETSDEIRLLSYDFANFLNGDKGAEISPPAERHGIEVGDRVGVLKDARKWLGVVEKVNTKTYKVFIENYYGGPTSMNVAKEKVAHVNDRCTIVCDYVKDPNGMSVYFDYTDDYVQTHKKVGDWEHQPGYFESKNHEEEE